MKSIDSRTLKPGTITEQEYYTEKGELLFAKGVKITIQMLDTINRRNIFELFVKKSDEEELHELVTRNFEALDDINVENMNAGPLPVDLKDVQYGKEGLKQLVHSPLADALDAKFRNKLTFDVPVGPALSEIAKQIAVSERTDDYKKTIIESYEKSRGEVEDILNSIALGERISGKSLNSIVKNFVKIYLKDRNILINISTIKPATPDYIYSHSLNVCLLAINIAAASGYGEEQVVEIGTGALLHDVGMLLVPKEIILKTGRLDQDEWYEIQKHPILGLHLLEKLSNLQESVPYMAYQAHERENGKGYPKMRNGILIHRFAKIVQVADIYEAMSSPRTYRIANSPYNSIENLIKMVRQGLLNGEYMKSFLKYASLFPVGSIVVLNDGRLARVIDSNPQSYTRPVLSVLSDNQGKLLDKGNIYQENLSLNKDLQIVKTFTCADSEQFSIMDGF
jgi:HD-GYP domain-containing protein (c-di-GMP phosphodiesterase class II)